MASQAPAANAGQTQAPEPDLTAIEGAIRRRLDLSPWVELRAIMPGRGKKPASLWVGRGDDTGKPTAWAATKNRAGFGVYPTFNVIEKKPAGYAKDEHVSGRALIFIDIDPVRPANTSATDAGRDSAASVADAAQAELLGRGWGEPFERHDTGNGQALYYLCEPDIGPAAVKALLDALESRHGTPGATIDTAVYNPARVSRLPGTVNTKGDVHRLCRVPARNPAAVTVTAAMVADAGGGVAGAAAKPPKRGEPARRGRADIEKRAAAYLATIDPAVQGANGSDPTFWAARVAVYGFDLGVEAGLRVLLASYNPRCSPPWTDAELRHKCEDADAKPYDMPRGWLLNAGEDKQKPPAAADSLAAIGGECELFRDDAGEGYAAAGPKTYAIRSKAFRLHLVAAYRRQSGKVPNRDAIDNALTAIEADAQAGPTRPVCVRVAAHAGRIYYHLADAAGTVIEIDATGWRECASPPVRFIAPPNASPQVAPARGGSLELLRRFVNCPGGDEFALFLGWLAAALRGDGPFPVLVVTGEQGSAKSTTIKVAKLLIDPSRPLVRTPPKEDRDLMVAAKRSWCLAYDNLSRLPDWLSDGLAALATGGGFGVRALFTDADEMVFDAKRPVILGGIPDYATRADLLERSIALRHPHIAESERRLESEFWDEFRAALPLILGALFDRVAAGLRELPGVNKSGLPRMADAAAFALACELGSDETPRFLSAYRDNQGDAHESALADSPVAAALVRFMDGRREWRGSPSDLFAEVSATLPYPHPRDWPKKPNAFTGQLRRDAPALRRGRGIDVDADGRSPGGNRGRVVRITRLPGDARDSSSPPSRPSRSPDFVADRRDDAAAGDRPATVPGPSPTVPGPSRENATIPGVGDDGDGRDDESRPLTGRQVWHTSDRPDGAA